MFDSEQTMLSLIEPNLVKESSKSEYWIKETEEELDQIEKN